MKQKTKLCLLSLIVILGLIGWIAYMETHYGSSGLVPVRMTEEKILEEMSELAITEQDEALHQAVLSMPQVQRVLTEAKQSGADVPTLVIPRSEAQTALNAFLPDGNLELSELCVMDGASVYLTVIHGPTRRTSWQFYDGTISKSIGVYHIDESGVPDLEVLYSNDHNGIQKLVEKHLWFYWLGNHS